MLLQQSRQAPAVGRVLRILLGLALMIYLTPVYFDWHLQPNPYRCIATHRCLWPVPWGDCGERVARRVVCGRRFGLIFSPLDRFERKLRSKRGA